MTDRTSLFKLSGLPDPFGVVLLILSLILLLSPYFSGADFGVFKIPLFTQVAKKWLKVIGPILFIVCTFSFVPIITINNSSQTSSGGTNPTITPTLSPSSSQVPSINQSSSKSESPTPTPSTSEPESPTTSSGDGVKKVPREVKVVSLDLSKGEHLHYRVTAVGANPTFSLSNRSGVIISSGDFKAPPYEWEWPRKQDSVAPQDNLAFAMSFIAATKYTLTVEHHDRDHKVLDVLINNEYTSDNPKSFYPQVLSVISH